MLPDFFVESIFEDLNLGRVGRAGVGRHVFGLRWVSYTGCVRAKGSKIGCRNIVCGSIWLSKFPDSKTLSNIGLSSARRVKFKFMSRREQEKSSGNDSLELLNCPSITALQGSDRGGCDWLDSKTH
jgi:hypothetical protein